MDMKELAEKLAKYPNLKQRMEEMLAFAENSHQEIILADAAEERVIEVVRSMGLELMQSWADSRSNQVSQQMEKSVASAKKNIKKKFAGIPPLVK
jgi:vacuolar-type H+-ATPase subunit B/Vma2